MGDTVIYLSILTITWLYLFWCLYVLVMGVYRAHLDKRITGVIKWMSYPIVLLGLGVDVISQYTIATVFFADLPVKGEHLVTSRLQRYISSGSSNWRYKYAKWICDSILDPFDPSGDHC